MAILDGFDGLVERTFLIDDELIVLEHDRWSSRSHLSHLVTLSEFIRPHSLILIHLHIQQHDLIVVLRLAVKLPLQYALGLDLHHFCRLIDNCLLDRMRMRVV